MRSALLLYFIFILSFASFAQTPVMQWQKNFGGNLSDRCSDLKILPDGNFILLGTSYSSNNGDITGNHGPANTSDVCLIKSDPLGNVLWKKSYGGSDIEDGVTLVPTTDGGFIFVATSKSIDGDITGHHGTVFTSDVWVVKLDASGNIIWQKSYGGSSPDYGGDILETSTGFIISGTTGSTDGDVSGNHGGYDLWVLKIDPSGNITWQKCYGGTKMEGSASLTPTLNGGFLLNSSTGSTDGDVSNPHAGFVDAWIIKIASSGAIIWDKCIGGNSTDNITKTIVNNDGSYFLAGYSYSKDIPGAFPDLTLVYETDAWVILLDANGNTIWQKAVGGTKGDVTYDAIKTADGGYLLVGETSSNDGIVCQKHLQPDMWMIKMDNSGNIQWNRTYGGSQLDQALKVLFNAAGECIVLCNSLSSDGDVIGNNGITDIWVTRFSFTGPLIAPAITITASMESIRCAGSPLQFTAAVVNGGSNPTYQWKINGINTGTGENPVTLSNLFENDIVTCVVTTNDNCVDVPTATSNSIQIKVKLPPPIGFLPKDTALCSYQRIELGPNTTRFSSYLWSDGSTTMNIKVKVPGLYWLQVTDQFQCIGRDSVTIFPKTCIEGIFIPNAFTPNKDGKNDLFMPIMNVDVKQYHFMVYDRWGRRIFETTTVNAGWDGTLKGIPYNSGVFAWQCLYQLEGDAPTSKRGTVLLLR